MRLDLVGKSLGQPIIACVPKLNENAFAGTTE